MNLKQHNDIVEKLLKELNNKESQINILKKQLNKTPNQTPQLEPTIQETKLNKKISQLNKEHKERVNQLTQQLKNKSLENKDLKQRLVKKKNMELKEKQHTSEILKKHFQQSMNTQYDYKVNALVSHYEGEIQNKNRQIESLQKQVRENFYEKKVSISNENQHLQSFQCGEKKEKDNLHLKYQAEVKGHKAQTEKYKRLFDEKSKEFKDLAKKYSELTKEYYRIVNEYAHEPKNQNIHMKKTVKTQNQINQRSKTGIQEILQNVVNDVDQNDDGLLDDLTYSTITNDNKVQAQQSEELIQNIAEILEVQDIIEILPSIVNLKSKYEETQVFQAISRYTHSMLYRMGMGKIPMKQIIDELERFENRINKMVENTDLLDQVCIEVGAKKNKLLEKIRDFKATEEQFFTNMKDIKFMQKLPKANKIVQFINYFELDKEIAELPDQLKKMYEQLKYVDKFMKQANTILEKSPSSGIEKSLEGILRYLERKSSQQRINKKQGKFKNP